jgi:hypothetical protein
MVGKVIGVCASQRRADPKKIGGEGFLQHTPPVRDIPFCPMKRILQVIKIKVSMIEWSLSRIKFGSNLEEDMEW